MINTVFIRISAHLEYALILEAEKVNNRPASNKRPSPSDIEEAAPENSLNELSGLEIEKN